MLACNEYKPQCSNENSYNMVICNKQSLRDICSYACIVHPYDISFCLRIFLILFNVVLYNCRSIYKVFTHELVAVSDSVIARSGTVQ
jgi:hypothetical protein